MTRQSTFASLHQRDFRWYFIGKAASQLGAWMTRIGQAWLVLELTGSGTLLGVTAALQYLPYLFASLLGGVIADRADKRRLLIVTEAISAVLVLALTLVLWLGVIQVWMIFAFALALGCATAAGDPAKKAYVYDMVGRDLAMNAIALTSVVFNLAKTLGPAIAGGLIAVAGVGASFIGHAVGALVFVAVLVWLPRRGAAATATQEAPATPATPATPAVPVTQGEQVGQVGQPDEAPTPKASPITTSMQQLREGFRYALRTRDLVVPLVIMTVAGLLAYEWNVTLPLYSQQVFGGNATTFGLMFSAMGIGAIVGSLFVASRIVPTLRVITTTGMVFSALMVAVAIAPARQGVLVLFVLLGAVSTSYRSIVTAWLQIMSPPDMRGRVMALLSVAMQGTTAVGAPLIGWLAEVASARVVFVLGGGATAVAVLVCVVWLRRWAARDEARVRETA